VGDLTCSHADLIPGSENYRPRRRTAHFRSMNRDICDVPHVPQVVPIWRVGLLSPSATTIGGAFVVVRAWVVSDEALPQARWPAEMS